MQWGYLLILYPLKKHVIHKGSNNEIPALLCLRVCISKSEKEYGMNWGKHCQRVLSNNIHLLALGSHTETCICKL